MPDFKLLPLFCMALDFLGVLNTKFMKGFSGKRLRKTWIDVALVVIQFRHAHKWPSGLNGFDPVGSCPYLYSLLPLFFFYCIDMAEDEERNDGYKDCHNFYYHTG